MGCLGSICEKISLGLISVLKMLCAVAVILIVNQKLTNVPTPCPYVVGNTTFYNTSDVSCNEKCLLGSKDGINICSYAYAVAAVSMLASFALCLLLCFTLNCCGLGDILEMAFCVLGAVWWAAAAAVFTASINQGWSNGIVDTQWKSFIQGLAWTEVGLFLIVLLFYIWKIISAGESCAKVLTCCWCCGCCGCCGAESKKSNKVSPV